MSKLEIRALRKSDDRDAFSCGNAELDRFFRYYAGQNQFKLRIATTYVALSGATIVGFATVCPATLRAQDVPDNKIRKRLPAYPVPILRLARLGVAQEVQKLGIGKGLLRYVLQLACMQRDLAGCAGVIVDAKQEAIPFYQRLDFLPLRGAKSGTLHGGLTPMFLSMKKIELALGT